MSLYYHWLKKAFFTILHTLKYGEQADKTILWALQVCPSHANVTSVNDFSSLRCLKDETMLVWKSFQRRQNCCWSPCAILIVKWFDKSGKKIVNTTFKKSVIFLVHKSIKIENISKSSTVKGSNIISMRSWQCFHRRKSWFSSLFATYTLVKIILCLCVFRTWQQLTRSRNR